MLPGENMRIAIATPLPKELHDLIAIRHPDVQLLWDQTLLPPMRWAGDFKGDPSFERTVNQQKAFEAMLDQADVIYGIPDVSPAQLKRTVEANDHLRWVMVMAAGGGAVVKAANLSSEDLRRVAFTTSAGVHAGPLSEFALFGLLCGAKNLVRLRIDQREHHWPPRWPMTQLSDSTVTVVGMGHLGKEIAKKLKALGTNVIGVNKTVRDVPGVTVLGMDRLLDAVAMSDGVVSTLPGTAATKGIFSAEVIFGFKPGSTFVSVGRGTVVDEDALIHALKNGTVGFAALDVFAAEPLPEDNPLWDMSNVLVSPHTAANSAGEEKLIAEFFCDNLQRFKNGAPLLNVVDTKHFY